MSFTNLQHLLKTMQDFGVTRVLAKHLSPNDNTKNQVYLGPDMGIINVIPASKPTASEGLKTGNPIFKAAVNFHWIDDEGQAHPAPNAQLILYPQYPEVRFSGFLKGAGWKPSGVMAVRDQGRVLLFGLAGRDRVFGYAAAADSQIAQEVSRRNDFEAIGVFRQIPLVAARTADSRIRLLNELCRISNLGWIRGWRLQPDGSVKDCFASHCVGVTLESELGITANGRSEPDFEGWEIKGHTVPNLTRPAGGPVTLLTPEPTGGFYVSDGVEAFVKRFGYADKRGRASRFNFGGVHRVGQHCSATGLTLQLDGYDVANSKLTSANGSLLLTDNRDFVAASWSFTGLLAHWSRKHTRAAFVPAIKRKVSSQVEYRYGEQVLLAEGTDYMRLLRALASGDVYYDPGIKVEYESGSPRPKKRSQFRVSKRNLTNLYHSAEYVRSCG